VFFIINRRIIIYIISLLIENNLECQRKLGKAYLIMNNIDDAYEIFKKVLESDN